jgi:hypothetical protein
MYNTVEKRNEYAREYSKREKSKKARSVYRRSHPEINRVVGSQAYIDHCKYVTERKRLQREMLLWLRAFNV